MIWWLFSQVCLVVGAIVVCRWLFSRKPAYEAMSVESLLEQAIRKMEADGDADEAVSLVLSALRSWRKIK